MAVHTQLIEHGDFFNYILLNSGNKSSEIQRQIQPSDEDYNTHVSVEESIVLFPFFSLLH